ncbi:MAG: DUF3344 domain-containing protein [Thermoanaerobaculia bacterium]
MSFHRKMTLMILALLAFSAAANATQLGPFIDLQEQGLSMTHDGHGLWTWGGGPVSFNVTIGGPVRFALLYWAGRERPCTLDGSGTNCPFTQPYKDQVLNFNGAPITGTVIGSETQPTSGGGPILNVGYYADVTGIVSAAGTGPQSFTLTDGDTSSNFWRFDGAALLVAYKDGTNLDTYRILVQDGLDFAYGDDPTPGDNRVTAPVTFNHGVNFSNRTADLLLFAGDGDADRPDNTTISNNPTLFNILNSTQGPEYNTVLTPISIPSGAGTTTVQMNSAPAGQNPDSLLWELAALRVQQLDIAGATCPARVIAGPPTQLQVTVSDVNTGIQSIVVTQSDNADTPVPPFTVGTTDPVTITATKINQSQPAHVTIQVTDLAGNTVTCDPVITLIQRSSKEDPQQNRLRVPAEESKIQIMNGEPGLRTFTALVNGVTFKVTGLRNNEVRTLDVSSAMRAGNKNIVYVKGHGPQNASATVVLSDGSVQ